MLHTRSMKWRCLEALQHGTQDRNLDFAEPFLEVEEVFREGVCPCMSRAVRAHACAMETARTALLSGWKARLKAHREPHCPSTTKLSLSGSSGTGQPLPTTVLVFSAHAFPSSSHFPPKPGLQKGAAKQTSKKHTLPPAMNQFFHLPSLLVFCVFFFPPQ